MGKEIIRWAKSNDEKIVYFVTELTMWEYKIYKTDLWYGIYRKKNLGKMVMLQYLTGHDTWCSNKILARTFYKREDAVSALVVIRHKDEWKKSD